MDVAKLAYGGAFIAGGIGVGYLTKYIPKKYKIVGKIGSVGLGAYGAYSIYQALREPKGEKPGPDLHFPVNITNPQEGEEWSTLWPHRIKFQVSNPYNRDYNLHAGCSLIYEETGEIIDLPIQSFVVSAGETKDLSYFVWPGEVVRGYGKYWLIVAVWDVYPENSCEQEGTCHRLGEDTIYFFFTFFG